MGGGGLEGVAHEIVVTTEDGIRRVYSERGEVTE